MMKTKRFFLAALMCAIATTALTVACNKDDDNKNNGDGNRPDPVRTPKMVEMTYIFRTNTEMLTYLDMTLDYYAADGTIKTLIPNTVLNNGEVEWRDTIPVSLANSPMFGMRLNAELKEGVDTSAMETTKIKIHRSHTYFYRLLDSVGTEIRWDSASFINNIDVKWSKLDNLLHQHGQERGLYSNGVLFSTDGTVTKKSSWPLVTE